MLRFAVPLVVLSLLYRPATAEIRTWTDNDGRQIRAKFVRVHNGDVVLLSAGRAVKVPFSGLSADDRQFVGEQLDSKRRSRSDGSGTSNGLPPALENSIDESAGGTPASQEYRTWTDVQMRQSVAKFVGFADGNVMLFLDGKEVSYPFDYFSSQDQALVASILRSRGQGHLVPSLADGDAVADGEPGEMEEFDEAEPDFMPPESEEPQRPGMFGGGPPPRFPSGSMPMGPGPGMRNPIGFVPMPPNGMGMPEMGELEFPEPEMPESESHSYDAHDSHHDSDVWRRPSGQPSGDWPPRGPAPCEVMVKYCTKCNYILADDFELGKRCPGCNVKIVFEENPDGTYTTQSGKRVSHVPGPYTTGVTIVLSVIVMVVSIAVVLSRL